MSSAVSSRRNGTGSLRTGASSSSAYRRPAQTAAAIVAGAQASPIAYTVEIPPCAQSGIGSGRRPAEVAPAALASTFVTSVAGVITFTILSINQHGSVAPDWPTGIALGVGGLAGAYTGARIQSRMPDVLIRRLVGILVVAIGARYLWSGLG